MSKKVLSVLLAVAMLVTMLCVAGVSAGASDAKQMEGGTIYFEVPESWGEITSKSAVYAHIWVNAGGEELSAWQTKAEKMKLVEGRTFSYTIPKSPAEPDSVDWNMVIFSMYQVDQTYDLTMNLSCLGDTAYVTGNKLENPVDSNKTVLEALWKNNKDQGPHLVISSIGNIVGSTVVPGETLDSIIEAFVTNYPSIATEEKVAQLREELAPYFENDPGSDPTTTPTTSGPTDEPTTAPDTKPTTPPTTDPTDPVTDPATDPVTDPTGDTESTTDQYGRERGIPVPMNVQMPKRVMDNNGQPGNAEHPDWDGYYRIYYFRAPAEWMENAKYKEDGYEIGFYWFYGEESGAAWPGVPATKLNVEGYEDVYYAIAPSYANNIIWNNGINGGLEKDENFDPAKKAAALQTADINVEDGMFNQIEQDDLCGSIFELNGETIKQPNPYTGEVQLLYLGDWSYFNPLTGAQTTQPLTVDGEVMIDENGFNMNPYFDMDYSYVRKGEPIPEPSSSTLPPSDDPTNPTNGTGKNPGTVNTAQDVASFFVLATILLAAAGVVVIARRKKAQG